MVRTNRLDDQWTTCPVIKVTIDRIVFQEHMEIMGHEETRNETRWYSNHQGEQEVVHPCLVPKCDRFM